MRPIIPREVENEIHFLTTCNAYTERGELFNQLSTIVPVLFNLDIQIHISDVSGRYNNH